MLAVLDSSAVLAFLKAEPGAQQIADFLGRATVPAVCVCEIVTKLIDAGLSIEQARSAIISLGLEIAVLDEEGAFAAAGLRQATRSKGLSLADRVTLALASERRAPVYTADRNWIEADIGVDVRLIR